MKFVATYTETIVIERIVEADSEEEATKMMNSAICNGDVDLSYAEVTDSDTTARQASQQDIGFIPEL